MIKTLFISFLMVPTSVFAYKNPMCGNGESEQHPTPDVTNNWRGKFVTSPFGLGMDIQTKYMWRGMEMMTEDSAPVLFPQINYQYDGLFAYVMGATSLNGKYSEVDLGVSYTWNWLTVGINGYYYPTTDSAKDTYFDFNSHSTGHWWEGVITVAPENVPVSLTLSNFFAGADKNADGKQAYSTYAEIGTHYDFLNDNTIALALGAAFNKSCYNAYEHNFGVCNVELKYTHQVHFRNDFTLPLSVSYIVNPINEKSFVNFTMSFSY